MTVKSVELKSESFFLISCGVLELWRKYPKGLRSQSGQDKGFIYAKGRKKLNLSTTLMIVTNQNSIYAMIKEKK